MERAAVYLSVCLSVLAVVCQGQMSPGSQEEDQHALGFWSSNLVDAVQGLLEGSKDRTGLSVEKKASVIPQCDVGERCALKHGPRIGRLCDCLRGTACNTFFLRCY